MLPRPTLLLDGEQVEYCRECGTPSTCSLQGREGWHIVRARPGGRQLVDVCPECYSQMGLVVRAPTK